MKAKTRIITTLVVATLTIGLFHFQRSTSAQSARSPFEFRGNSAQSTSAPSTSSNCKKIRGNSVQVFDPATGVVSGPVTNAGILNGTINDVIDFGAGFLFTPDPNVLAYLTDFTITTTHGQLKSKPVTTQSIITSVGAEWGSIDPNTSTGAFAGATGTFWLSFKPIGDPVIGPWEADLTVEICFAQ